MRTTLDLDPVVLSAARALAAAEGTSIGKVVSDLALRSLTAPVAAEHTRALGFPVLHGNPEHLVTDNLVAEFRENDDHVA